MRYVLIVLLAMSCGAPKVGRDESRISRDGEPRISRDDEQRISHDEIREELRRRDQPRDEAAALGVREPVDARLPAAKSDLASHTDTELIQLLRARQKSVYGVDDRKDLFEMDPPLQQLARSVAAVYLARDLQPEANQMVRLPATTLAESHGVCDDERFAKQPALAICTAFVVGPSLLATAAHCLVSDSDDALAGLRFVFGHVTEKDGPVLRVSAQDVYRGRHVRKRVYTADDADWALIETDRVLGGRAPLALAASDATASASVHVQGYPSGLPLKAANRARVRKASAAAGFFVANLDTFGGNSGSPVFNASNEVIGILVRGAADYVMNRDRGCRQVLYCPDTGCGGEESTKVSAFRADLPPRAR